MSIFRGNLCVVYTKPVDDWDGWLGSMYSGMREQQHGPRPGWCLVDSLDCWGHRPASVHIQGNIQPHPAPYYTLLSVLYVIINNSWFMFEIMFNWCSRQGWEYTWTRQD